MVTQQERSGGVTKILAEGRKPSQQLIAAWSTASPWWSCRPPWSGSLVQPGPVSALPSSCLYNLLCQMEAVVRGGIRALLSRFFSFVGDCSNISRSPAVTECPAAQTDSLLREFSPSFHPTPHISASTVRGGTQLENAPSNNSRAAICQMILASVFRADTLWMPTQTVSQKALSWQ